MARDEKGMQARILARDWERLVCIGIIDLGDLSIKWNEGSFQDGGFRVPLHLRMYGSQHRMPMFVALVVAEALQSEVQMGPKRGQPRSWRDGCCSEGCHSPLLGRLRLCHWKPPLGFVVAVFCVLALAPYVPLRQSFPPHSTVGLTGRGSAQ